MMRHVFFYIDEEREVIWVSTCQQEKTLPLTRKKLLMGRGGVSGGKAIALTLPGWIASIPHLECQPSRVAIHFFTFF